ncbi:TetR/AcrR family transcriptional regulator [Streptomyces sp. ME19-01-6]|uniref:TetR/AcrR family transcriptional regulator n=1 Tax=Streptomyces sp. ME19-01-6 TaxID=3028686 RepID=UPI0029A735BC|nr:TetR/AcrR family transcriptional regulator [Streptomyces sp. ME19-01-6]MDX3232460.1 TetR/AcrR family transcriptional regulator [Streptomyces sp. ME19-01-6]
MGRPRDTRVDEAILAATRELLARNGYAGLTVDAVAEHAGIGKAAIYRRYATKQEMVFAAAVHRPVLAAPPDTGSLRGDLTRLVEDIVATLGNPAASSAVLGLLADLGASSGLADRFHASFVTSQRAVVAELMGRAVARGELGAPPDVDLAHALLAGPVFATLYLQRRRPDGLAERLGRTVADTLRLEDQAVGHGGHATGSATT